MKRNILLAALLLFNFILYGQVTFGTDGLEAIAKGEREAFTRKSVYVKPEKTSDFDVKWYRCSWNIDPAVREISGSVTTLFTPVADGLDSLVFDMGQPLVADSVLYHQHPVLWDHSADLLTIRLPLALSHGAPDSVTVYYHGIPAENGSESFTQGEHNGSPVIWTFSEPYGASDWWPCKNGLTDKADSIDIILKTPEAYKGVSNGILQSVKSGEGFTTYRWKHRYPIAAYLVCLGVTNYAEYSQVVPFGNDTLNVFNYVYPEDSADASTHTGIIVSMIQLFDSLFGIYPFQEEKYGHAEWGVGGGMEHQTITFVNSFGFELLAHELAHQWFGDKVTCGSWTDIWLNEGFATYLSGICYEHLSPDLWTRFRQVRVEKIISKPDGSVYCPDTTDVARIFDSRLSYAKGCMILHQLRWIFGDTAFFKALNDYLFDAALSYGFARTPDLIAHMENAFKQDLSWYFEDWYTGEGYPSYKIKWTMESDSIKVTFNQTQSHPSVSFFEMVVPLQFKGGNRDTIVRFFNTFPGQTFTLKIPFTVDSVIVDPDYQIISGNNIVNGIGRNEGRHPLTVFPNPATDKLTFRFSPIPGRETGTICIYDHSGRIIKQLEILPAMTEISVNTGSYAPGLYFYVLSCGKYSESGKVVVL